MKYFKNTFSKPYKALDKPQNRNFDCFLITINKIFLKNSLIRFYTVCLYMAIFETPHWLLKWTSFYDTYADDLTHYSIGYFRSFSIFRQHWKKFKKILSKVLNTFGNIENGTFAPFSIIFSSA